MSVATRRLVAIREGQERGEVADHQAIAKEAAIKREAVKRGHNVVVNHSLPPKPTEFAAVHELHGAKPGTGIYHMTDNVTDAEFEEALTVAKDEGNVPRFSFRKHEVVKQLRAPRC